MSKSRLILITNPGSSSRKYALYQGQDLLASLHFEFENKSVICTIKTADGTKKQLDQTFPDLNSTVSAIQSILTSEKLLSPDQKLDAILARVAAPGDFFAEDHLVDDNYLKQLEIAKQRAPLHVPVVAGEIDQFVKTFQGTPVIAISDSAFHATKPPVARYYAIDTALANDHQIKRYGYHGLSVGSIVEYMRKVDILPEKLIICHIGSGTSVSAVKNGAPVENSMGYSPLEGAVMSTRSGNIDLAAALAIKKHQNLSSDQDLELYLNKQSGLKGLSGQTDDMREIIDLKNQGDERADFAFDLFIYRLQSLIGQAAASLDGVDALVFTATIGERNAEIRAKITEKLSYLGFSLDPAKNTAEMPNRHTNIAKTKKPLFVIRTDEFEEMLRRATLVLDHLA